MDVTEQNEVKLALKSTNSVLTYICGAVALWLGILFITGSSSIQGNNIGYQLIVGPIAVICGLIMLLSPIKCVLTIDIGQGLLTIKKGFLFGLIPVTRRLTLTEISEFQVQHQLAYKLRPATLKFIFRSNRRKLTFSSGRLHFEDGSKFLSTGAYDPRNSIEEKLVATVSEYINVPITPAERRIDSLNINYRVFYVALYIAGGFVVTLFAIWAYNHL